MLGVRCGKTAACKHEGGCLESILTDSSKVALSAYLLKLALSLLLQIRTLFRRPSRILQLASSKQSVRFGLFAGSFVLIFRGVLCILRRWLGGSQ